MLKIRTFKASCKWEKWYRTSVVVGGGHDGRDQNEYVMQLLMCTARELKGNGTADLTTPQRVHQEHSTGIKKNKNKTKNPKQKQTAVLPTCKQGKSISQIQSSREVNVFKLFLSVQP